MTEPRCLRREKPQAGANGLGLKGNEVGGADLADMHDKAQAEKERSTLIARAAVAGFVLTPLPDGTWSAGRWGHERTLANADEVERFLGAVGAPS